MEEEDDECARDTSERKVDVEAPSPSDVVGEGTTHQWASNGGNAVHGTDHASVGRSLAQGNSVRDNEDSAREDTGTAHSGDRSANDKCYGVGGCTTDQGADFEDGESGEVDPFEVQEGVHLSEEELEGASCEEVGGAVPADIINRLELVRNFGDCRCWDAVSCLARNELNMQDAYQ